MKFFLLALVFALSAAPLAAQSLNSLLRQAEKAHGGSKRLQSIRSITRKGTIVRPADGAHGRYVYQSSVPNLLHSSYDLNGKEVESGYNGRSAWIRADGGITTVTGTGATEMQMLAQFRNGLWLNAKREKSRLVSSGKTVIDGKPANAVTLTTQKGLALKLYFDAVTGLLIRDEVPQDGRVLRTDHGDYRSVSGVQQPYFQRLTVGDDVLEIRFDDVRINEAVARSAFDFPQHPDRPLPDVAALLNEVQQNEDKVENILDTYSYIQRSTRRELGKDGVLRDKESEAYQLSFYKGRRIRRLVEKNGKALTADQQKDEDKEVAKRVEDIEKDIAKAEAKGGPPSSEDDRRISIAEVLRASTLKNPRREIFRGRDVIVFDFEPNPQFDYKNAKSMLKFFGKTAGSMWIDEKDKQVARLEAFLADSYNIGGGVLAKLKKGASFTLEQERINDEIWLPSVADINLSVRVLLVKGIDVNQVIRSYDYRKFATEVKDAKVN